MKKKHKEKVRRKWGRDGCRGGRERKNPKGDMNLSPKMERN